MKKVNIKKLTLSNLAQAVCILEGKKSELDIAQVKEVIRCISTLQAVVIEAEYRDDRGYRRPSDIINDQGLKLQKKIKRLAP